MIWKYFTALDGVYSRDAPRGVTATATETRDSLQRMPFRTRCLAFEFLRIKNKRAPNEIQVQFAGLESSRLERERAMRFGLLLAGSPVLAGQPKGTGSQLDQNKEEIPWELDFSRDALFGWEPSR